MVRSSLGQLARAGRGLAIPEEQQLGKATQNKGRDFFREVRCRVRDFLLHVFIRSNLQLKTSGLYRFAVCYHGQ